MTKAQEISRDLFKTHDTDVHQKNHSPILVDRILGKLSHMEISGKEYLESYIRHKWCLNHKPRTMFASFTSITLFIIFCQNLGRSRIEEITAGDLEAFIEHEQDRGINITSVRTKLAIIIAFLHFLIKQDIISGTVLKRRIRLKLPDALPRAINPADVKRLLTAIDNTRDRALILLLLRTGIRIGEALGLTMNDLDIGSRKVHLYEGEKNSMGRVVYLSDDALFALKLWLAKRDKRNESVFYAYGRHSMCYSSARTIFVTHIRKAGLEHKGYTVHCLRHTFASELLNAGMRLECLQQLMGHQNIEVTRRYARLTDRTREDEYFRAMAVIEQGGIDGNY